MKNKIIIAIDGYSSTGKSTLAKQLAAHLGYVYVDTGAMYRAVTLFALENGYISEGFFDRETLIQSLPFIKLHFEYNPNLGFAEMYLNGRNVENEIRSIHVSGFVSLIAEVSAVRAMLVEQQQQLGSHKGIVMDGRDIGTIVFPDADLKIFMTASAETRAKRRYEELLSKGQDVSYDEVLQNVTQRDHIDTNREDSPLRKADDAIEIDNSHLTRDEQFCSVLELAQEKLK